MFTAMLRILRVLYVLRTTDKGGSVSELIIGTQEHKLAVLTL